MFGVRIPSWIEPVVQTVRRAMPEGMQLQIRRMGRARSERIYFWASFCHGLG